MVGASTERPLQSGGEFQCDPVGVGAEVLEKVEKSDAHSGVELLLEVIVAMTRIEVEEQEVLEVVVSPRGVGAV